MHSSMMRTARSLPYKGGGSPSRGVSVRGYLSRRGSLSRGSLSGEVSVQGDSPVNRMTDASKNITLPQTSFADGNYDYC